MFCVFVLRSWSEFSWDKIYVMIPVTVNIIYYVYYEEFLCNIIFVDELIPDFGPKRVKWLQMGHIHFSRSFLYRIIMYILLSRTNTPRNKPIFFQKD